MWSRSVRTMPLSSYAAQMDRRNVPIAGNEKETLLGHLQLARADVVAKCEGLDDEAMRRRLVPSLSTIGGIVNHLAYVERWWFADVFAGRDCTYPWTDEDPDAEFRVEELLLADIVDLYQREGANSDEIVARAELDALARRTVHRGRVSLRWITLHMLDETARHAGQLDILRELIDSKTGE